MSNQAEAQRLFELFQNLGPGPGNEREANLLLIRVLEKDPSHVEARMEVARRYANASFPEPRAGLVDPSFSTECYNKAIAECTQVIEIAPNHLDAYKLRGHVYGERLKKYDLAISDFSNAIKLSPNDVDSYVKRGRIYLHQENYEQVSNDLDMIFSLNPKNPDAVRLLESSFLKKNDFLERDRVDKIVSKFEEEIDFNDSSPKSRGEIHLLLPLYKRLGLICIEDNNYKPAISYCKKVLEYYKRIDRPDIIDPDIYNCLGTAYNELGEYKNAIVAFDKVLKKIPDYPGASEGRTNALLKLIEKQEKDFQEKIEGFLSGPTSIFKLQDHFFEREKECKAKYRNITKWINTSLLFTFATIIGGIFFLIRKGFDIAFIEGNVFSFLPYLGIVLIAAVPAWWTRVLLRSRDRWQILREDCFRKAAIMQYIQATGRDKEFRNQIILETIKHIANRSGADLLVALHTDDLGPYSVTDSARKIFEKKSKTSYDANR